MVKSPYIKAWALALALFATSLPAEPAGRKAPIFKMEFSKREVFVGEQVYCNFIVYTPEDLVEVEVAKFPEFRGFWKENLVLRQGPMSTTLGLGSRGNSALVGTYLLIPMFGTDQNVIEPMKVVVRSPSQRRVEGSIPPQFVLSLADPLKIKPLPPLPRGEDPKLFTGAVGKFSFFPLDAVVNFQKDEPTVIRFALQGQGNFAEINNLAVNFPPQVEVIAKRTSTQGNGQYLSKEFDITVAVHSDSDFILDPVPFVYFDPELKRYDRLASNPVKFQHVATPVAADTKQKLELGAVKTQWHASRRLKRNYWFYALNIFFAIVSLTLIGKRLREKRAWRIANDPKRPSKELLDSALRALAEGETEKFLKIAETIAIDALKRSAGLAAADLTRKEILSASQNKVPAEALQAASEVFKAHDALSFSPSHRLETSPEPLVEKIKLLTSLSR